MSRDAARLEGPRTAKGEVIKLEGDGSAEESSARVI